MRPASPQIISLNVSFWWVFFTIHAGVQMLKQSINDNDKNDNEII